MSVDPSESTVVVGAGPAGTAVAIALRSQGRSVVLLDRARFPRDKVCGDVLLPEALEMLSALGLDLTSLEQHAFRCTGARYIDPRGGSVNGEFRDASGKGRPWWMVRRTVLDAWLVEQARRSGADVREGTAVGGAIRDQAGAVVGVTVVKAGKPAGRLRARVVVGADGASSAIARSVGAFENPPEHTCLAVRAYARNVVLPAPYLEVMTTRETLPGCAWIVPVGPSEANVGLGILKRTSLDLKLSPAALFASVVERVPHLAKRLSGAELGELRGWSLPGAGARRRLSGAGWLLAGDAGAMVDPFTGHGIHHALAAGRIAAEVIDRALAEDDVGAASLGRYDILCDAAFASEVAIGAWLQRAHARPTISRVAVLLCRAHPGLRERFLAIVGHAAPRRELLAPRSLLRAVGTVRPRVEVMT